MTNPSNSLQTLGDGVIVPAPPFVPHYAAPIWLPGGHLQSIWPSLFAHRTKGAAPKYKRERLTTPDQDFVDVDWLASSSADSANNYTQRLAQPLLVLFHGLEGSSRSHYAEAFADYCAAQGWAFAVPHFRGCSGQINLAPRAYHSGDFEEVDWMLKQLQQTHAQRSSGAVIAVGVSLGGNALLRWAQEAGDKASQTVCAVAAVCAPVDLLAGGTALGRGVGRQIYTRMFLRSMKPKALQKLAQHPGLFDKEKLLAARTLYEFDNVFTAPLHGFLNTEDYWSRASAKPHLARIRLPALVINARNDPFVPAWSLPQPNEVGNQVVLWQPRHGGHVGFTQGRLPGHVRSMPEIVGGWMQRQM